MNPQENPRRIETPENWQALLPHEYSNIFPLLSTDDLETTLPTMWETGYDATWPIVMYEGQILDGRNRLRAAIQAKCVPVFAEFHGTRSEALAYSVRANLHRRQLNDNQRAMVGAKIKPMFAAAAKERQMAAGEHGIKGGRGNKTLQVISPEGFQDVPRQPAPQARDEAAAIVNVSPVTLDRAAALLTKAPDLAAKVEAGEMGVWQADAERKRREGKLPPKKSAEEQETPSGMEARPDPAAAEPKPASAPERLPRWLAKPRRPYVALCHTEDPTKEDRETLLADPNREIKIHCREATEGARRLSDFWTKKGWEIWVIACLRESAPTSLDLFAEEIVRLKAHWKERSEQQQ